MPRLLLRSMLVAAALVLLTDFAFARPKHCPPPKVKVCTWESSSDRMTTHCVCREPSPGWGVAAAAPRKFTRRTSQP